MGGKAETVYTTNGATAYGIEQLGDNVDMENPGVNKIVSLITEMWSASNMSPSLMYEKTDAAMNLIANLPSNMYSNYMSLLMCYVLYKRDIKSGSGRRDESRSALIALLHHYKKDSELVKLFLRSYFKQGYWGDAVKLVEICLSSDKCSAISIQVSSDTNFVNMIKDVTIDIMVEQLYKDNTLYPKLCQGNTMSKAELYELREEYSNLAKWIILPRARKGKGKRSTLIAFEIARKLFPNIKENTWYHPYAEGNEANGKLNTDLKYNVSNKTPLYLRWRTLFANYNKFIRKLRQQLPYVEKYMQQGEFHNINPTMLTSVNKLRYDSTINNTLPRYIGYKAKTKVPRSKIEAAKKKYGLVHRFNDGDRPVLTQKYNQYKIDLKEAQRLKAQKMAALRFKIKEQGLSKDEQAKLQEELDELASEKTTNFEAGNPVDVYNAYEGVDEENPIYEACIQELSLGKFANLANIPCLTVADTSGSMFGGYWGGGTSKNTPISQCIALTAFFASNAPSAWRHKFIQFAGNPFIRDMVKELGTNDPSFYQYIQFMKKNQIHDMNTNFERVLDLMHKELFTNVQKEDLPKYLIFFSDMQFDQAVKVDRKKMTAGDQVKQMFVELGFTEDDAPTIVFWNLNASDNRPARATDDGVVMLSGFNPQMLLDLDNLVQNAPCPTEEEYQKMLLDDRNVNTWKTLVNTVLSTDNNVEFLEELSEIIDHTLLGEVDYDNVQVEIEI